MPFCTDISQCEENTVVRTVLYSVSLLRCPLEYPHLRNAPRTFTRSYVLIYLDLYQGQKVAVGAFISTMYISRSYCLPGIRYCTYVLPIRVPTTYAYCRQMSLPTALGPILTNIK